MTNTLSRENFHRTGVSPVSDSITLTNSATEYTYTPPVDTKKLWFQMRNASYDLKWAFGSGGVFIVAPAGSTGVFLEGIYLDGTQILYLKCDDAAGQIIDILYWT